VLSLVSLAHVRLATSAQRISGLHVFLGFEVKLTLKKVLKKQGPGKSLKSTSIFGMKKCMNPELNCFHALQ